MILSGCEIKRQYDKGSIKIEPFRLCQLNPNSYNLRLGDELLVYKNRTLSMKTPNEVKRIKIPESGFVMKPGRVYLGSTMERTETHGFVPMLEGRSSCGRLGIACHVTAGFGDVGFKGHWTLELWCVQPARIYPNVEICQIFYHTIQGEYFTYDGKYQDAADVQASMMHLDFAGPSDYYNG
ncbi:MAG: dCTP deaminase [Thermoguttaceae bacterium]|nr:dCTP deaminase [Thermoguttaceae bacterium]